VLPVLFRRKLRLIITVDGITDIVTAGITIDITITTITIAIGLGLSASTDVQGIIAIGKRIVRTAFHHSLKARAQTPAIDRTYDGL